MTRLTTTEPCYPIARNGIFWSFQSEGHLRRQMVFLRLAGCSVGCAECDTDYSIGEKLGLLGILKRVAAQVPAEVDERWVWLTGGEPLDHDISPLVKSLQNEGYSVALATSGIKKCVVPVDWLSVSPHSVRRLAQVYGNEIKLVPGLNGLKLNEFIRAWPDSRLNFWERYVQPLWLRDREDPDSLAECIEFVKTHPLWSLSRQDHKVMALP